jgi:hypothetical protein
MGYRLVVFNISSNVRLQNKGSLLGQREHTSFEAYEEDIGKLCEMAEHVLFTIMNEAVKYDKFKSRYSQVCL